MSFIQVNNYRRRTCNQWFSVFSVVTSGTQWLPVVISGSQLCTSGTHWFSCSGSQWLPVVLNRYQWLSVVLSGY